MSRLLTMRLSSGCLSNIPIACWQDKSRLGCETLRSFLRRICILLECGISAGLLQVAPTSFDLSKYHMRVTNYLAKLSTTMQLRSAEYLQMHVMDNVRQRLEAGHKDFVDEIRVCTVLFIGFPSLKVDTGENAKKS